MSDTNGHVSHYPPGSLSAYTHGSCRCDRCKARNTRQRQQQRERKRAGLPPMGAPRRSFEQRVREEMGASA